MPQLIVRSIAALLLCALLSACAGRMPRPQVELPPLRLAPSSLPTPLALQQLEADAQQVQLAVQAMGQTGVRLRWDGRQLTEQRASWLPPQVRAERVLDDLQFALWPTAAIAAVLPAGWQVSDDGHQRSLSRDGTVWLQLQRLQDGSLQLDNRAEGYALRIESIDMEGQD